MEGASASGIEDPVEDGREDEEGDKVQNFVVDNAADLDRREASIASYSEEEDEGSYCDVSDDLR